MFDLVATLLIYWCGFLVLYFAVGWIIMLPWLIRNAVELRHISTMFSPLIAIGIIGATILAWPLNMLGYLPKLRVPDDTLPD